MSCCFHQNVVIFPKLPKSFVEVLFDTGSNVVTLPAPASPPRHQPMLVEFVFRSGGRARDRAAIKLDGDSCDFEYNKYIEGDVVLGANALIGYIVEFSPRELRIGRV